MTLLIADNLVVSIQYKLTDDDGQIIDQSEGEPLKYLHGASNIIPGLEQALTGKVEGDSLNVTVAPENGYGEIVPELIQVVNVSAFQGVEKIEPGMIFQAQAQDGSSRRIMVKHVDGEHVTIDANHPLAGKQLHFEVTIEAVRAATEEEIQHGHAH